VIALSFVYRHPEGLSVVRGLDDRDRQVAADVCLRFRFLRRFQDLEKLLGVGGGLEAREKQVYVGFLRKENFVGSLALQPGFKGMEGSSLDLEWIRQKLVLVQGVSHLRVGKLNEDAFWTATLTTGVAGNGIRPEIILAGVLHAGIGTMPGEQLAGKELERPDLGSGRVLSHESTMVIKSLSNAITEGVWNRATRTKWDVSAHSHDGKVLQAQPCKCYCSVNSERLRFLLRISSDFFEVRLGLPLLRYKFVD
jgi:hypothetical protein